MKVAAVALQFVVFACVGLLSAPGFGAPDEELLGKSKGYPIGTRATWYYDESVRVGSFSHLDQILPHNTLPKAAVPLELRRAASEPPLRYTFQGQKYSIDDYLNHQRVTGLLVIKDGEILVERYQYERKPADRLLSQSMAKSLVSLAIGFALAEGSIHSLDDTVATYVPELKGYAYGETTIRHLLRMSSGVRFSEEYDGKDDLAAFSRILAAKGNIPALQAFDVREAPQGERFHYASIETQVLAVTLHAAIGKTLSEYLTTRLWQPMGAEADATWATTPGGLERASGNFSATLRDWGRLGVLLANDGRRDGKQILPLDYLLEATDWHRQPEAFAPKKATAWAGYGYQFWTLPGEHRRFELIGVYGQSIFVDPEQKLVLVQTAVAHNARVSKETMGKELGALWYGLVNTYGRW